MFMETDYINLVRGPELSPETYSDKFGKEPKSGMQAGCREPFSRKVLGTLKGSKERKHPAREGLWESSALLRGVLITVIVRMQVGGDNKKQTDFQYILLIFKNFLRPCTIWLVPGADCARCPPARLPTGSACCMVPALRDIFHGTCMTVLQGQDHYL